MHTLIVLLPALLAITSAFPVNQAPQAYQTIDNQLPDGYNNQAYTFPDLTYQIYQNLQTQQEAQDQNHEIAQPVGIQQVEAPQLQHQQHQQPQANNDEVSIQFQSQQHQVEQQEYQAQSPQIEPHVQERVHHIQQFQQGQVYHNQFPQAQIHETPELDHQIEPFQIQAHQVQEPVLLTQTEAHQFPNQGHNRLSAAGNGVQVHGRTGEGAARIIGFTNERDDHSYKYSYETENGIKAQEIGTTGKGTIAEGAFSYKGADGLTYTVSYVADENGFRPQGAHLPTPPPIPDAILKSMEQNAKDEANGIFDDGQYPPKIQPQHQQAPQQQHYVAPQQQYRQNYQRPQQYQQSRKNQQVHQPFNAVTPSYEHSQH